MNISSRPTSFAQYFVIYWLLKIAEYEHQESHHTEIIHDEFAIFAKLERQKKTNSGVKHVKKRKEEEEKTLYM